MVGAGAAQDADVLSPPGFPPLGEHFDGVDGDAGRSQGLINYLMRDRHGSPFEHNSMTFFAPILCFGSSCGTGSPPYNEESGRYRELRPVFYAGS